MKIVLRRFVVTGLLLGSSLLSTAAANGEDLKSARVTQVVKDVKLLPANAAAKPASPNDDVKRGTAVRTGVESRAELTFTDLTLTRLGANTVFSFDEGTRDLKLSSGALLVEVPRTAPAAKVTTAAVTAAITGGTMLFEYHNGGPIKMNTMEGDGTLCPKGLACRNVPAGEMLTMTLDASGHWQFSQVKVDEAKVYKSSKLIGGFGPLANKDLIMQVIQQQQQQQQTQQTPGANTSDSTDAMSQRSAATQPNPPPFVCPFPKSSGGGG